MTPDAEFHQRDRSIHPPAYTPVYKTSSLRSPRIPLWSLQNSLSEVTGPMFTPDGHWLLFSSNRATPEGKSDTNLFLARFDSAVAGRVV